MERKDRKKRKALEPLFVSEKITELTSELKENDAMLREEIQALRDEISSLKRHLESKNEESARFQAEAEFLHPDAVVDRVRTKFWHHGDLSLLRKAVDPRMRVLRNTENRSDRALYICDTAPKKAGGKGHLNDSRLYEFAPKQESEEASVVVPERTDSVEHPSDGVEEEVLTAVTEPVTTAPVTHPNDVIEEETPEETSNVSVPFVSEVEDGVQSEPWPQQDDAQVKPLPQQEMTTDVLMCYPN